MCKYVIVITVIARQDVDGHFGTTLKLPAAMLSIITTVLHRNQLTASYWLPGNQF